MTHVLFMRRCLELAEHGRGKVSPNPLVGCVITKMSGVRCQVSEEILVEAWHEEFGSRHAEILAIEKATYNLREATLYVNLEPCSHHGKTPPCTDAIIAAGIKTVVFGARDPLHGGAKVLKQHGIEVVGPVLEAECRRCNRGFFSLIEQGRPWVTLKKALRHDGSVPSEHITNEEQDQWAHTRLRATHDAVLVGSGTILTDNPQLNVRHNLLPTPYSLQPRRIILDLHSEVPPSARVLTDDDAARTLVIREKLPIPELLRRLKDEGITSVLVEGGPTVWSAFEQSGMCDEIVILVGRKDPDE